MNKETPEWLDVEIDDVVKDCEKIATLKNTDAEITSENNNHDNSIK